MLGFRNLTPVIALAVLAGCGQHGYHVPDRAGLGVVPAQATVAPGGAQQFQAVLAPALAGAVPQWRVVEPAGGSITPAGLYTAPATPGLYHVQAYLDTRPVAAEAAVVVQAAQGFYIQAPAAAAAGATQVALAAGGAAGPFRWRIQGGAFAGGLAQPDTAVAPFVLAGTGPALLTCDLLDAAGQVLASAPPCQVALLPEDPARPQLLAPAWVTAGDAGVAARVAVADAAASYAWTAQGGTLDSAAGPAVTFTAGAGPVLTLTCAAGASQATVGVAVAEPPRTPTLTVPAGTAPGATFTAGVASPRAGCSYRWTLAGGAFDGGAASATGTTVVLTAAATGPVRLTCAEVNPAGRASAAAEALVPVAAAAGAPGIVAPAWVTAGSADNLARVAGFDPALTYAWSVTGGEIQAVDQDTVRFRAGDGPSLVLACTAAAAGAPPSAPGLAGVGVAPVPEPPLVQVLPSAPAGSRQVAVALGRPGESFLWGIQNGLFLDDAYPTAAVAAYQPTGEGPVRLFCKAVNAAGARSAPGFAEQALAEPSAQPLLSAPAWALRGGSGLRAQVVDPQPGHTYRWSIDGGALEGGATGTGVTFTAGAGPLLVLACTATDPAGATSAPGSVGVLLVDHGLDPAIQVAAPSVPAGSAQVAWVAGEPGLAYAWTVTGGTPSGATDGPVLAYTAGAAGTLRLACTVSRAGVSATATLDQTVTAAGDPPVITAPAWVTAGVQAAAQADVGDPAATYAWTVQGGSFTGAAAGPAVQFVAAPGAPAVLLTCVATPAGGAPRTGSRVVAVAPVPPVPALVAPAFYPAGQGRVAVQVDAPSAELTYRWRVAGGRFEGGLTTAEGARVFLDGAALGPVDLTCSAVNRAGAAGAEAGVATLGLDPASLPKIQVTSPCTAGSGPLEASVIAAVPAGTRFTWTIQGGVFADGARTASGARVTLDTAAPGARLLACQAEGAPSDVLALAVVDVLPKPEILAFGRVVPGPLYLGQPVALQAVFQHGAGAVDAGIGPVLSGAAFTVAAAPATYTLTVRNAAGAQVQATCVLDPQTVPTAIAAFAPDAPVVGFGHPATLRWRLVGEPTSALLTCLEDPHFGPVDVKGLDSYAVAPLDRRTYRLAVTDPLGASAAQTQVAARGLRLLAGDAVDGTRFFLDGPVASAAWRSVGGLTPDDNGAVYFTEPKDQTLRCLTRDLNVRVFAGQRGLAGIGGLDDPQGVTLNQGDLWVADRGSSTLKAVASDGQVRVAAGRAYQPGGEDTLPGQPGALDSPVGVAAHPASGFVFVTEPDARRVRMVRPDGAIATLPPLGGTPFGLAVDAAGTVYVSDPENGRVVTYRPRGPLALDVAWDQADLVTGLDTPTGLALDSVDGAPALRIVDTGAHCLRSFSLPAGPLVLWAGTPGTPGLRDGDLLDAAFREPVWLGINGGLAFVCDQNRTAVRVLNQDSGKVITLGGGNNGNPPSGAVNGLGPAARFQVPVSPVVDAQGRVYVADKANHVIRRILPDGQVDTYAGAFGTAGGADGAAAAATFTLPAGLGLDAAGNLYVLEQLLGRVRKITPAGEVSTVVAGLVGLRSFAVGPLGDLVLGVDAGAPGLRRVDAAGVLQPGYLVQPAAVDALALDSQGRVFGLDLTHHEIWAYAAPAAGAGAWSAELYLGYIPGAGNDPAEFNQPEALAVDAQGNLFVADGDNGLVRKVAPDRTLSTVAGGYPYLGGGYAAVAGGGGPLPGKLPEVTGLGLTPSGDLVLTADQAVFRITAP